MCFSSRELCHLHCCHPLFTHDRILVTCDRKKHRNKLSLTPSWFLKFLPLLSNSSCWPHPSNGNFWRHFPSKVFSHWKVNTVGFGHTHSWPSCLVSGIYHRMKREGLEPKTWVTRTRDLNGKARNIFWERDAIAWLVSAISNTWLAA
jgi:hypothetical protein